MITSPSGTTERGDSVRSDPDGKSQWSTHTIMRGLAFIQQVLMWTACLDRRNDEQRFFLEENPRTAWKTKVG